MENLSFSNTSHMNTSFANVIGGQCFVYNAIAIKICRAFAYGLLILGSVVGNSLVIAVVRRDKNTKQTLGYFIQNMAVADLLITVVYMPRMISAVFRGHEWLIDGTLGLVLCKIVPFCHHAAIFVSIQTLVVISVERFLAVVYPLKRNITKGQAKLLIALAWIVSVAVRIPRLLALTTQRRKSAGNKLFCRTVFSPPFYTNKDAKRIYYEFLFYLFYLVPLSLVIVLNLAIIVTLKRRKAPGSRILREQRRREALNRKIFRMLFTVTCLFILCWLMYFIVQIVTVRRYKCLVGFFRLFLAHANSALTPCVYFLFNASYRRSVQKILFCKTNTDSNEDVAMSVPRSNVEMCSFTVNGLTNVKRKEAIATSSREHEKRYVRRKRFSYTTV